MALDNGPVDYRQLQGPEQLMSAASVPTSGRASEAEELSQSLKQFSSSAGQLADKAESQAGAIAGAAMGATGNPNYKTGLTRLSAYSTAYNNAATGAYAMESEVHAEDLAAKLRVQANNDPATFAQTYAAARDATVKEAPPMAQAMLTEVYNRHLAAGVAALSGSQAEEIKNTQKQIYDKDVDRSVSRVAILQGSANPQDQLQALDEHTKLVMKIDGGVNSGLYSHAEGEAMKVNATREITKQVFDTQVDRELGKMADGSGQAGDVVNLVENFRRAHEENLANPDEPPVFSETEFNSLYGLAKQKIMQQKLLDMYTKNGQKTAQQLLWEQNDAQYTALAAVGHTDVTQVSRAIAHGDLEPEKGRAILGMLTKGQDAPPNKEQLFLAMHNPNRFDWSPQDIDKLPINSQQKIELSKSIANEQNTWESHPAIKDADRHIDAELKMPAGGFDAMSGEEKTAYIKAHDDFRKQLSALPVDQRDAQAPRVANNVIYARQATTADAEVAMWKRGLATATNTYGPSGTSPDPVKFARQQAFNQAKIKAAQDAATQARAGITK